MAVGLCKYKDAFGKLGTGIHSCNSACSQHTYFTPFLISNAQERPMVVQGGCDYVASYPFYIKYYFI